MDIVLRLLIIFFKRLGLSIGTHPLRYLGVSLLVSLVLLVGIVRVELRDDIRSGYSKEGSRSVNERTLYCEFSRCASPVYTTTLVGSALDGGSMVREAHLEEFLVTVGIALNNITTVVNGYPFSLNNLTNHASLSFQILRLFLDGLKEQNERQASGLPLNPHIALNYPIAEYYGQKASLTSVFYGVDRTNDRNLTGPPEPDDVQQIAALFLVERGDEESFDAVKNIELRLFDRVSRHSNLVSFQVLGDEVVNREVVRGAQGSVLYFVAGLLLMIAFVTFTVVDWQQGVTALNWTTALLVGTSIVSPLLAAGAVLGVLSAVGQPINSMMCIMPFLLLGIGVDDAFLMIYGWRKLDDRGLTRAERLSQTFEDVGPSITITSLTNVLAFSVGAVSASPAIRAFCICTAMALVLDFILEIAFFGAVVAVACAEPRRSDDKPPKKKMEHAFLSVLSKLLVSWPVRAATVVFLIALWTTSTIGVLKLKSAFSPDKTFDKRSRLVQSLATVEEMFHDHENTLIIVNRPPRISDEADLALFNAAVRDLRSFPDACAADMTVLWLEAYVAFDKDVHESAAAFGGSEQHILTYGNVPEFLSMNAAYDPMVHWSYDEKTVSVDSFSMYVCATGSSSWRDRADHLSQLRDIIDRYRTFNMSTFVFDSTIFDMILSTNMVTVQSVVVTLASMVVVCVLFIPSFGCVAVATGSIMSMILAVVGFLSWWDCDMDIITMVDILMAVGFTVDFTAHFTYHYSKTGELATVTSKEDRLCIAYSSVGYPMIQAGISTAICVAPLLFYDVYMYRTFVKTIFLTVGWGMLHGLLLLPIVLASLPDRCTTPKSIVAAEKNPNKTPEPPVIVNSPKSHDVIIVNITPITHDVIITRF